MDWFEEKLLGDTRRMRNWSSSESLMFTDKNTNSSRAFFFLWDHDLMLSGCNMGKTHDNTTCCLTKPSASMNFIQSWRLQMCFWLYGQCWRIYAFYMVNLYMVNIYIYICFICGSYMVTHIMLLKIPPQGTTLFVDPHDEKSAAGDVSKSTRVIKRPGGVRYIFRVPINI